MLWAGASLRADTSSPPAAGRPVSWFRPLIDVNDAFRALEAVASLYSVIGEPGGFVTVHVRVGDRTGDAAGLSKAQTICLALAKALGILDEPDAVPVGLQDQPVLTDRRTA